MLESQLDEINKTTQDSLESTRKMISKTTEMAEIGINTLVDLHSQGNQLQSIIGDTENIDENLDQSGWILKRMSFFGMIKNMFRSQPKRKRSLNKGTRKTTNIKELEIEIRNKKQKQKLKEKEKEKEKKKENEKFKSRSKNDKQSVYGNVDRSILTTEICNNLDEQEENINQISDLLKDLREISILQGEEIDRQAQDLDTINEKIDTSLNKIDLNNRKIDKILY
ncbi:synaptosomal associated protein [Anaeramoeba flamelloides]|uniref:Synaptosomal associated protein n=1 Tax=Anaeramoeba flamelloides TaxID=1746091 RepID=A0AAV7YQM7_9EUKA|nr:synaptosomal associated protein [Anaeramoeba flamelloides]